MPCPNTIIRNNSSQRCQNSEAGLTIESLLHRTALPLPSFLFLALALLLNGCDKRLTAVEAGNKQQILHLGNGLEPFDLDPHTTTGVSENNIHMALFEGLINPDPVDLHPRPGVAERWHISNNGLTYTFYLREETRWSNGDPVTAEDFVFSYKRILSPALGAVNASLFYVVENAEAFNRSELTDFSRVGIKAKDDYTLEIKLKGLTSYFLSLIMHPSWFPVHPPTILKHGLMDQRATGWTRPGHHVGNGPFSLREWKVNEVLAVEKNPYYWDVKTVRLQAIHFYPIESLNTEERAFRAGQLHVTEALSTNKVTDYQQKYSPYLRIDPYLGIYYYLFNVTQPPLNDPRIRRALNLAIDRRSLVENVTRGRQKPAYHFTPPEIAGYTVHTTLLQNLAEARRLLAEAGYAEGVGFPPLELLYNTSENNQALAEAIQQMWKKNLNINVKLLNQEWKVYLDTRHHKDYTIARSSWIGDYNDPNSFLEVWTSNSGNNHSSWSHSDYDALVTKANHTADPAERLTLFQQAEAILLEEVPMIPLYFYVSAYLIQPSVKNWHPNLLDWHPYKYVYLEPTVK